MQLTTRRRRGLPAAESWTRSRLAWASALAGLALVLVYWLDHETGAAPFQHLYYAPIVLAAVAFGAPGGLTASLAAIVLYHLANPPLSSLQYAQGDVLQIGLFLAVGLVAARLANNARTLRLLAHTDDLTGLHNLRSFEARLNSMVRRAQAEASPLALLVLDVDHLKSLNDRHGHLTGAEAVRLVGHLIAAHVTPGAVPCRYGGDEFVIALPRCPGTQALEVANRIREAIAGASPVLAGRPFPAGTLSVSIGVACRSFDRRPNAGASLERAATVGEGLFRSADAALYAAKNGGRDRVVVAGAPDGA